VRRGAVGDRPPVHRAADTSALECTPEHS
jgi:hypothetical protein